MEWALDSSEPVRQAGKQKRQILILFLNGYYLIIEASVGKFLSMHHKYYFWHIFLMLIS
jgi:hypothetical protein